MANINPGLDGSGNGNNWAPVNINFYTSSSTTYDVMTDVPTLTSATVANYCVLNPLQIGSNATLSDANLTFTGTSAANYAICLGTIGVSSGKWYWEVTATSATVHGFGIATSQVNLNYFLGGDAYGWMYYYNGTKYNNDVGVSYGASYTTNDVIGFALDADAGTITAYKNGVSQGTMYSGLSANTYFPAVSDSGSTTSSCAANFGQRPFAYTPPANYVALNTYNLPTPTIGATASSQANKYFDATTYTGSGSTQSIVNSGAMQPDMVWLKIRSSADSHNISDSVRGISGTGSPVLFTNGTGAEATFTGYGVSALNSNGFTLIGNGGLSNASGSTYVAWQWRAGNSSGVTNTAGSITSTVSANTTSGFSIVTYTGTGSAATVGHGLGVAPKMVIVKQRNSTENWGVYHASLPSAAYYLQLNTTAAQDSSGGSIWNSTAPSSSVLTVGTSTYSNANGSTYVAYCFAEVAGFSKFGSYTGNGSTDGPFIFCGFRPRYIMIKRTDAAQSWWITDTARNPYNTCNLDLFANLSNAEENNGYNLDLLSNGVKIRTSTNDRNASGGTYVYACFAESPLKYANAR
jgi:hypothetical protein